MPVTVTAPWAPWVTAVMVRGEPHGSVSLARTAMVTDVPAGMETVSAEALGGVLHARTFTVTVAEV